MCLVEDTWLIKVQVRNIFKPYTANHNNCRLLCHLILILKVISANSVDPDQTVPLGALHKQTTISDVGFLGVLRVKVKGYSCMPLTPSCKITQLL